MKKKCKHEGTFGNINGIHQCVYCKSLLVPPYKAGNEITRADAKKGFKILKKLVKEKPLH